MDFRPPYAALVERLQHDLGSLLRAPVSRQNLPARAFPDQPALVVLERGLARPSSATWDLEALLVLHTKASGDDQKPGEPLLELIAAIDRALRWKPGEPRPRTVDDRPWTTLGGLALRVRLEDASIEDDLYDAEQVSTLMRVRMLVPDTE